MHPIRTAILFLALATPALRAQLRDVVLRGEVDSGQSLTCYYCPTVTPWVLHGSETPLLAGSPLFGAWFQHQVEITGKWNGSTIAPIVQVDSVKAVTANFGASGNSSLGSTVRWTTTASPGDLVFNVVAGGAGFTPVGTSVFLLDPATSFVLGVGVANAGGTLRSTLAIPRIAGLLGMPVFGQGIVVPALGLPIYTTNPDARRIG